MDLPARLTVRNLLNSYIAFVSNPEARDDPWARPYTLSLAVIRYFLGENWLTEHTEPGVGVRGFLRPDIEADNHQVQFFKSIDLAELLFNLQHIEGFDGCLARLRGGDIEPTLAELDAARMLYINDHMFWFIEPQGKQGDDFDFRVILPGLRVANIEAKCNIETPTVNLKSIENALNKARRQLPSKQPGIVFLKLPPSWIDTPNFAPQAAQIATNVMRNSSRVVSVKYYVAPFFFQDGWLGQGHRFMEITSPHQHGENWDLLKNWIPAPTALNKLPPKWVRMVFFSDRDWR